MTTLQHIYAIKNIINKGIASDDTRFSNRLILHLMNVSRAILLEQKLDKYVSIQAFQSLCTDLVEGQYHNCCDIKIPKSCTILKSTTKIPELLSARWGSFVKVTTLDGSIIPETNITQNKNAQYSLTNTTLKDGWFIHDNYLYVVNNHELKKILINGLWSKPQDIANYNCPDNKPCFAEDSEYPIDSDLTMPMYEMVIAALGSSNKFPQDDQSDSRAVEAVNRKDPNE